MAPVTDQEFRQIKKFMSDSHFTYTDEWLIACMTWIKDNNSAVNLIRDIGESSYSQWTKLKKLENENVSVAATDSNEITPTWQPTPKRCLYLTMTDCNQEVYGLEMQPIPGLNLNMKPGFKIIILGPVDCRRGVVHLRPNIIKIIGGEVEDLLESNRMEKVLADTLKLTSIPATQSTQPVQSARSNPSRSATVSSTRDEVMGEFPESDDPFSDMGALSGDDDDIFMEIDEEALLRSESRTSNAPTSNSQVATQKIDDNSSKPAVFTEEIEDFEDDFTDDDRGRPSSSTSNSRSAFPSISNSSSALSAGRGNQASLTAKNPKPVFVPPMVQPRQQPAAAGSSSKASSSTNSDSGAKSSSVTSTKTPAPTGSTTSFKSAKSALNNNNAKQLNIMQYLKPMPVIIDPPTPERQLKRRRKSEEGQTGVTSTLQTEVLPITIKEEDPDVLNAEPRLTMSDDDTDFFVNSPAGCDGEADVSLSRIVDETVENKIRECSTSSSSSSRTLSVDSLRKSYAIVVPEFPYVFISQIKEKIEVLARKRKIVKVKACVSTVVSNIKVEQGKKYESLIFKFLYPKE